MRTIRRLLCLCCALLLACGTALAEEKRIAPPFAVVRDEAGSPAAYLLAGAPVVVLNVEAGEAVVALQAGMEPLGRVSAADLDDAAAALPVVLLASAKGGAVTADVGDGGMALPAGTMAELLGLAGEKCLVRLADGVCAAVQQADVQLSQSTWKDLKALLPEGLLSSGQ